jgi:hypothetical protein
MKKYLSTIAIIISLGLPQLCHADITTGLTAWLKFNEGSGTTAADSSGNGYTGTLENGALWTTGHIWPNALQTDLNVTGNSVSEVSVANIPIGSTWTISAWSDFPLSATGQYKTMTRGANDHAILVDPSGNLGTYQNTGGSGFYGCLNGGLNFNVSSISAGWHMVTFTGSGGTEQCYIDAAYVGTVSWQTTDAIEYIGNYQGGAQTWGTIDDFRVYNRVLSSGDITQLYNYTGIPSITSSIFSIAKGAIIRIAKGSVFRI